MHPSESAGGTHDIPLPFSFPMFSLDSISITQSKQAGCLQDKPSIQNDKALAKMGRNKMDSPGECHSGHCGQDLQGSRNRNGGDKTKISLDEIIEKVSQYYKVPVNNIRFLSC